MADREVHVFVYDPTDPLRYGEILDAQRARVRVADEFSFPLLKPRPIAYIPLDELLALDQAADFLNLPVSAVRQAVTDGRLPTSGPHALHVRFADLLAYRADLRETRHRALEELSEIDRELGLEG
jgi:hypothetical protein